MGLGERLHGGVHRYRCQRAPFELKAKRIKAKNHIFFFKYVVKI